MNQDNQIILEQQGALGVIKLNRPESLNALSLEMIREVATTLKRWESDDSISAVLFLGEGGKAFCAGGDVKSFYSSGMDYRRGDVDLSVPALFFGEEYSLNKQIYDYKKPTIAFMDGITMGGGYGIAGNCKYRIATENTVFAMPEVTIGFFPDVGSVYYLTRAPSQYGRYLALTGVHIGPSDMLEAQLADVFIESSKLDALIQSLSSGEVDLDEYGGDRPAAVMFGDYREAIENAFKTLDVFEICSALREIGSVWATDVLDHILSRSPISVMVTARYLEQMQGKGFSDVIGMDYQLAQRFIAYPDMYEGIRAALIDKDKRPVWEPEQLDDVKPEEVSRYFEPTDHQLDDVRIFA